VLITNEFHEFCWSTISEISDDGKAPYGPKFIHILIMSKTRGVHVQYDMKGWCGKRPEPSWPKVGPGSPTPLAVRPSPGQFPKTIFTTCQSKSVRGVSNVGNAMERLNLAAQPSCMVGRPDKWASRAQCSARAPPYSSYKNHHAPPGSECEESEVWPHIELLSSFFVE
jgi:hypothetical protein